MSKQYETVFILTPVLSDAEVKKVTAKYKDFLTENGSSIVHENHWGLRQLAYPIQKKTTGIYHVLEHDSDPGIISKMEVEFKRDESIMRHLTIQLDKYAVIYNDNVRKGLVGRNKKKSKVEAPAQEVATEEPIVNEEKKEA